MDLGLILVVVIGFGVYLAFAKAIPFVGPGYELHAKFANAATLRPDSPVRIAGVNVGKVTGVSAAGDAADVTFTVEDQGRPIHADATVEIRPRLFLEGNFFLDLQPGTPGGRGARRRRHDPGQPDSDRGPDRRGADGSPAAGSKGPSEGPRRLRHRPHPRADRGRGRRPGPGRPGQDRRRGAPGGRCATAARAGRDTSIVNQALLGNGPHDLSELIRALRATFGKLEGHEPELQELITNFNVTTGALAAESTNLSETIAELPPTLETARPSLAELSDSLPAVRALAIELRPSIAELPATIDAANPWLDQARPLLTDAELGGLSRLLERATPPLASVAVNSAPLFDETHDFARCTSENLVPTGDIVIDNNGGAYPFGDGAPGYPSGVSNWQDFLSSLVNQAGAGQGFDGNGSWLRVNAGGGSVLSSTPYPAGQVRNNVLFGNTQAAPVGTRPTFTAAIPPYRPEIPCATNPLPDINGTGGAGLPGDVGAPSPAAVP